MVNLVRPARMAIPARTAPVQTLELFWPLDSRRLPAPMEDPEPAAKVAVAAVVAAEAMTTATPMAAAAGAGEEAVAAQPAGAVEVPVAALLAFTHGTLLSASNFARLSEPQAGLEAPVDRVGMGAKAATAAPAVLTAARANRTMAAMAPPEARAATADAADTAVAAQAVRASESITPLIRLSQRATTFLIPSPPQMVAPHWATPARAESPPTCIRKTHRQRIAQGWLTTGHSGDVLYRTHISSALPPLGRCLNLAGATRHVSRFLIDLDIGTSTVPILRQGFGFIGTLQEPHRINYQRRP
jgi:hypothetical protein